jgi:hypothetical protein
MSGRPALKVGHNPSPAHFDFRRLLSRHLLG